MYRLLKLSPLKMLKLKYLPLISVATLSADTLLANQFSAEGVVSVGYIATDENTFLGDNNGDDAFLTENVLRLTYNTNKGFSVSGQVVYREAGDYVEDGLQLDFLQLEYRRNWVGDGEQAISLGRFKIRQGLYNQSRDIPFTRPSILLPQAVYLDTTRNFVLSADGLELSGYVPYEESDLSWSLAIGKSVTDNKWTTVALAPTATGEWDSANNIYTNVQWDSQNITLGMSYSNVELEYTPGPTSFLPIPLPGGFIFELPLTPGSFDADFYTLSFQYRQELWEFTSETINRDLDSLDFAVTTPNVKTNIDGYYGQLRYFFNDKVTLIARYDVMEFDTDSGPAQNAPNKLNDANDIMFGVSWRLDENWLIAIEHHMIEGGAWIPPLNKTTIDPQYSKDWNLTAVQLSYKF